jgi:hypothetical protein
MISLGRRALYWTRDDGLWDLGQLVDPNDWESLYDLIQGSGLRQVIGNGIAPGLPNGSSSAFLVTAVPEPSSLTLAGAAALSLVVLVRKRRGIEFPSNGKRELGTLNVSGAR